MSCKRRGNVMSEYVEESSSDEEQNDARDLDYDVSSSGRSAPGRKEESVGSNGSSEPRRRGRGVSKRPCLNRNAQMARENRQRKKMYLENVENKLAFYRQENKNLSNVIQRQGIDLKRLKAEVSYLKSVLSNSSTITTLLKSMNDTLSGTKSGGSGKDETCVEKKQLRTRNDSGNSNTSEKHAETVPKSWKEKIGSPRRRGGKYMDRSTTGGNPYGISAGSLKATSPGDSDHTYTNSGDGSLDGKLRNCVAIDAPYDKDFGAFSQSIQDRFISDLTTSSLNCGISEEIDELPQFNENLFDSIENDTPTHSMGYFCNDNLNGTSGNLFESLENSGICLHVNSGKISLEFCSICHLNSVNSTE